MYIIDLHSVQVSEILKIIHLTNVKQLNTDYQLTTFGSVSLLPVSLLRILKTPGTIKITRVCFNWLVI